MVYGHNHIGQAFGMSWIVFIYLFLNLALTIFVHPCSVLELTSVNISWLLSFKQHLWQMTVYFHASAHRAVSNTSCEHWVEVKKPVWFYG